MPRKRSFTTKKERLQNREHNSRRLTNAGAVPPDLPTTPLAKQNKLDQPCSSSMADLIQAQTEQGRIDSLSSDTQSESEAISGQEKDDAQQNVDLTKLGASSSSIIDIRQEEPETAVLCDLEQYNLTNTPTTPMTKSRKLDQPFSASMAPLTQTRNEQGRIDSLSIDILSEGDKISDIANEDAQQNDDLGPRAGGRPSKKIRGPGRKTLTNDVGRGVTPLFEDSPSGRGEGGVNTRRITLRNKHICQIEKALYNVLEDYSKRPWPSKNQTNNKRTWTRCSEGCECLSAAQCQQNAQAYIAVSKYDQEFTPKKTMPQKMTKITKGCHHKHVCASAGAHHRIDYYDSGQFGDANCKYCGAVLLESEANAINKQGRVSPCCSNGQCHTEQMKAEFDELQNPPQLLKDLVAAPDEHIRFEFLDNTMPLNNTFAFASVHSEKAPAEQMAGRMDTVKYNGEFSFMLSDLISPQGRRPTFAQVYTLMSEDALKLRTENITQALSKNIRNEILAKLELLMRENPLGQTFVTAGAKIEEAAKQNDGILPHFQIVLLTNRDLKVDALRTRTDCTIIERADAPTAQQVAVIWVQEDGLAPEVNGFWICDKAGKMRELKSGMPQLDPCCFPLLHPRGTFGWRWFMKKTGSQGRPTVPMSSHSNMQTGEGGQQNIDDSVTEFDNDDICDSEQRREFESDPIFSTTDSVIEPAYETFPRKRQLGIKKVGPQENISERQFYRYRLAIRENSRGAFHWLWFSRRLAEYFVIAVLNRIERNEMDHVKAIQQKKNYRQTLARDYIKAIEQGLQQQGRNAKLGSVFMMPHTFAGSRQYYQQKYADLMTVVRHLGNPTWFVTFTGNPSWPELKQALQGRQQYTHRADIVCRIFMDKASEFVRDLIEKNVLGKVAGWCYSVEHQKRGMPHIHILLILEEQGRLTTPEMVDQFVCARIPPLPPMEDLSPEANQQRRLWHYVTTMMLHDCNAACIELNAQGRPSCRKHFPKPYSELTELSEVRYTNYVRLPADMVDGTFHAGASTIHPTAVPNHEGHLLPADDPERDWNEIRYKRVPTEWRGKGLKGPQRLYEECGLPYMKRNKRGRGVSILDDSRVIPYNSFLLLKYGCHINIEYVFGQKACKYIFKYLLKGFEKAFVKVVQPRRAGGTANEQIYDYDEISATFKVRYMTSMEAYLRLHSYKIVSLSHQIYQLSIHDELGQTIVVEEGHEEQGRKNLEAHTRLTAFFALCTTDPNASELTYSRVPYFYFWNQKKRYWQKRTRPLYEGEQARMFVRVYTVSPKRHELFAIRALLLNRKGPKSFVDLRTIDGQVLGTFTEAAIQLRLLENDYIFAGAMRDACTDKMDLNKLQHYFALLIVHGRPSNPQKLFEDFIDHMRPHRSGVDDDDQARSLETRRGEVMRNLEYYFNCMDTSCSQMGLPGLPSDYSYTQQASFLNDARLLMDFFVAEQSKQWTPIQLVLQQIRKLNSDQRAAFDRIITALNGRGEHRCFFIEGAGGCGKTFLYNLLIRWCLAGKPLLDNINEEICQQSKMLRCGSVISAASTGIAALLLIGGGTVHRQFHVPNEIDNDTAPRIAFESAGAKRLRAVDLIIIDEISMLSNKVLNYVDRLMRDVCAVDKPFGGKVVVLGGDWRQLTPVVEHGTREDQIQESIKMDTIFQQHFEQISLTLNMRVLPGQTAFREWLMKIGNGSKQAGAASKHDCLLNIPKELIAPDLNAIIDFCFPSVLFLDPNRHADVIKDSAILCPTNNDVMKINELAINRLAGTPVLYESVDSPLDTMEEFGTFRSDFNIEAIHNETPSGIPPHKLILKAGAPIMLIRNLDVTCGLCNGTRLQVKSMSDDNLHCRILTGPREGQEFLIPRVKFEYGQGRHHRGLRFKRLQFPVRPCFAMTVNKSQGQTLQKMGLVLSGKQCFSHGQVYVAMSRVTSMEGVRICSPQTCRGENNYIHNVVFHELLDQSFNAPSQQFFHLDTHTPTLQENLCSDEESDLPC